MRVKSYIRKKVQMKVTPSRIDEENFSIWSETLKKFVLQTISSGKTGLSSFVFLSILSHFNSPILRVLPSILWLCHVPKTGITLNSYLSSFMCSGEGDCHTNSGYLQLRETFVTTESTHLLRPPLTMMMFLAFGNFGVQLRVGKCLWGWKKIRKWRPSLCFPP